MTIWTNTSPMAANHVVTAAEWNTFVNDNPTYLLNGRPFVANYQATGTDYNLNVGATWTTIDATNMACVIVPNSTRVKLRATFEVYTLGGSCKTAFDWLNNNTGVRCRNNNVGSAVIEVGVPSAATPLLTMECFGHFTGLTPGTSYSFYLQYYTTTGAPTLRRNGYPTLCWAEEY